jgi:phage tail tape-measure protein
MANINLPSGRNLSGSNRSFALMIAKMAKSGPAGLNNACGLVTERVRSMQQMGMSIRLLTIELQKALQNESRLYQTISNAMKARHDTAKAVIRNFPS